VFEKLVRDVASLMGIRAVQTAISLMLGSRLGRNEPILEHRPDKRKLKLLAPVDHSMQYGQIRPLFLGFVAIRRVCVSTYDLGGGNWRGSKSHNTAFPGNKHAGRSKKGLDVCVIGAFQG
jgi:hypothetical protein